MSESYNHIISKLQQGDQKVWRDVVNKYSDELFGYLMSLCSDHSIASDITQLTFVSLFEYRFKLNPDYPLKSFLYKTAYNKFVNYYHKEKSLSRLHEQYHYILEDSFYNKPDGDLAKEIAIMNSLIENLPKRTREVFTLKKKRGLQNNEISKALSISVKTVESHITKAFKLLREGIKQSS